MKRTTLQRGGPPFRSRRRGWRPSARNDPRTWLQSEFLGKPELEAGPGARRSLPLVAVHYLVKGTSVELRNGPEGPVGRITESDHVRAKVVCRCVENASARLLVADRRMPTADTQVGRGQHHHHRCLSQVVLINRPIAL